MSNNFTSNEQQQQQSDKKKKNKYIIPISLLAMGMVGAVNASVLNNDIDSAYSFGNDSEGTKLSFFDQDGSAATFINSALKYVSLGLTDTDNIKSVYYLWSDKNIDINDIKNKVEPDQLIAIPKQNGNYNLYVLIVDTDGKKHLNVSNTLVIDDKSPIIEFKTTSGTYKTEGKTSVLAYDNESGIAKTTYSWVKDGQTPGLASLYTPFRGKTITNPKAEGTYYLYVQAVDNGGNTTTKYYGPYTFKNDVSTSEKNTDDKPAVDIPKDSNESSDPFVDKPIVKIEESTSSPTPVIPTIPTIKEPIIGTPTKPVIKEPIIGPGDTVYIGGKELLQNLL